MQLITLRFHLFRKY